ncbi:MAG: sigma-70 family RNA polymerase sigma factor [Planctomycetota bacterium]|jgi:RNA polymerase sigma factor for flagellar operon FliA
MTTAAGKGTRKGKLTALERDRMVEEYLPLVRHVVGRIAVNLPSHVDTDELFQVGSIGLVNASRSFDTERGVAFKTYAFALIRGAVLDELRRLDAVPRSTREKIRAMDKAHSALSQNMGRQPTSLEVAAAMGVAEEVVHDLAAISRRVITLSIEDGTATPDALLVRDILACPVTVDPCDSAAKIELIGVVADRIRELPDAERRVVTMYYREGLLLREIGAVLGVTESRVSQIHSRALTRLQEMLKDVR